MPMMRRKPSSPGEILAAEFLEPLNLLPEQLAEMIKIPSHEVIEIINNHRAITSDLAIRLSQVFGTSAEVWLNLQMKWELWHAWHDANKVSEYESIKRA